jgi:hypothetical protein
MIHLHYPLTAMLATKEPTSILNNFGITVFAIMRHWIIDLKFVFAFQVLFNKID